MVDGAGSVIFAATLGDAAQEDELVQRQRLRRFSLRFRVGRGELDLVALVVTELEHARGGS